MKLTSLALAVLVFSSVVVFVNAVGLFDYKVYEPGYQIDQDEADGVFEIVDSSTQVEEKSMLDSIASTLGFEWFLKMIGYVKKLLGFALNIGGLFQQYVPGIVGEQFAILINGVVYFCYVWAAIQIFLKVSGKNTE